jgi:hypothetical protein
MIPTRCFSVAAGKNGPRNFGPRQWLAHQPGKTTFSHKIPDPHTIWPDETLSTSERAITLGFIRVFSAIQGGEMWLSSKKHLLGGDI